MIPLTFQSTVPNVRQSQFHANGVDSGTLPLVPKKSVGPLYPPYTVSVTLMGLDAADEESEESGGILDLVTIRRLESRSKFFVSRPIRLSLISVLL